MSILKPDNYVTLFDSSYILQGLALHDSLSLQSSNFKLWIVCLDDECFHILQRCNLANVVLLNLNNILTNDLQEIRKARKQNEFCWTLTPFCIEWIFRFCDECTQVTYLDADLYFFKDPKSLLRDFHSSTHDVLITEHAYAPNYDQSDTAGKYCVQFLTFKRSSLDILQWWKASCIKWCYDRHENGLFGDQRYFEYLPSIWSSRMLALSDSRFQAPWNAEVYRWSDAVFFHFHGFRCINKTLYSCTNYYIPKPTLRCIYFRYIHSLIRLSSDYSIVTPGQHIKPGLVGLLKHKLKRLLADRLAGRSNPPYFIKAVDNDRLVKLTVI